MNFDYRDFKISDLEELASIVGYSFGLDCYSKNHTILKCLMRNYLLRYLNNQNYAKVVLDGEKPIGIIIAKIGNEKIPKVYRLRAFLSAIPLAFTVPGWYYLTYSNKIKIADNKLLQNRNFYAELKLFVVDDNYQRIGIGKKMLSDFDTTCFRKNITEYCLFTDSYCDVDYYFNHNFKLESKTEVKFFDENKPSSFYLFSKQLN
jgi:GNAT superfamily N-acetyltransferase